MIDPLQLINNDMSELLMQSQNMFEVWTDSAAEEMNHGCVEQIQGAYRTYANEMNVRLRLFMHAEQSVMEAMQQMERLDSGEKN